MEIHSGNFFAILQRIFTTRHLTIVLQDHLGKKCADESGRSLIEERKSGGAQPSFAWLRCQINNNTIRTTTTTANTFLTVSGPGYADSKISKKGGGGGGGFKVEIF